MASLIIKRERLKYVSGSQEPLLKNDDICSSWYINMIIKYLNNKEYGLFSTFNIQNRSFFNTLCSI